MMNNGHSTMNVLGPTMIMASGNYLSADSVANSKFSIEDIAYGLAFEGRWGGQCVQNGHHVFYSVGQHCVEGVFQNMEQPPSVQYAFLMHELDEIIFGDMLGPMKAMIPEFRPVARAVGEALKQRFKVPPVDEVLVKTIDLRMMATERRDLTAWRGERWNYIGDVEPYEDIITPRSPQSVATMWTRLFIDLAPTDVLQEFGQ